ncbi:hypothetical protein D3C87_2120310 [compost metagenome]
MTQLLLERVQPARRTTRDEDEFHPCVAARLECLDGPVTDFSVVTEDGAVNIACYEPHHVSLRGLSVA